MPLMLPSYDNLFLLQNNQSYEEVVQGSLTAGSAISEATAVSAGPPVVPDSGLGSDDMVWNGQGQGLCPGRWQVVEIADGGERAVSSVWPPCGLPFPHLPQPEAPLWTGSQQLPALQITE
jgi:hypothetical protein